MAPNEEDARGIARSVVSLAQFQLGQMRTASENANNKGLGLLGFCAAIAAADIATGTSGSILGHHWWAVLVGLALAAAISVYLVSTPDPGEIGTNPAEFWRSYGGQEEVEATAQLIADLEEALERTRKTVSDKAHLFSAAIGVLVITTIYSTAVFTLVR